MDRIRTTLSSASSAEELSAFADGELSEQRMAEVAAYVNSNEEAAERLASYRRLQKMVREEFALESWHSRPLVLERSRTASTRLRPLLVNVAVCALGLLLGGITMALGSRLEAVTANRFADQALIAFQIEAAHSTAIAPFGASEADAAAFSAEFLAAPIKVPLLLAGGFKLVGWQPESSSESAVVRLRYEDAAGKPLVVLVTSAAHGAASKKFNWRGVGDSRICFWRGARLRFAMVGDLSREAMLDIAKALKQLEAAS